MVGRKSYLLTDTQREALTNDFGSLSNSQRSRLRSRIIDILEDFPTLAQMPDDERKKLFKKATGQGLNEKRVGDEVLVEKSEFRRAVITLFQFIFSGLRDVGMEYEGTNEINRLLENAIMAVEGWGETNVEVDITVERLTTPEQIREKFEKDQPLTDAEIGFLIREDMVSMNELEEIKGEWPLPSQ